MDRTGAGAGPPGNHLINPHILSKQWDPREADVPTVTQVFRDTSAAGGELPLTFYHISTHLNSTPCPDHAVPRFLLCPLESKEARVLASSCFARADV